MGQESEIGETRWAPALCTNHSVPDLRAPAGPQHPGAQKPQVQAGLGQAETPGGFVLPMLLCSLPLLGSLVM